MVVLWSIFAALFSQVIEPKKDGFITTTKYGRNQLTIANRICIWNCYCNICRISSLVCVFGTYFGWSGWDPPASRWTGEFRLFIIFCNFPRQIESLSELLIRLIYSSLLVCSLCGVMVSYLVFDHKVASSNIASSVGCSWLRLLMNIFRRWSDE